ncbi:histidine triad nucleotide-binding protein [PVC group bacterium (ex Bugula neritina AB1)]|nr:histidine triad nucleotide-binding protein [PVC group bacterium (ex Bugula neritina AB1)]
MSSDCLFCRFISGELPVDKVAETDDVLAFNDINPQAPFHILLIPKEHIPTLLDMKNFSKPYMSLMADQASKIAHQLGFATSGYRLALNCLKDGGQEIYHVHMHLLAGRSLTWPPG